MAHRTKTIIIILVLAAAVSFALATMTQSDGKLHVYFLDVGQGDGIFIRTPSGNQILVDGGPNRAVLAQLGSVMPFWDRSLDMVILSHPDSDHVGGLIDVLNRYKVHTILEADNLCDSPVCQAWDNVKQDENARHHALHRGYMIDVDSDVTLSVLWPEHNIQDMHVFSDNEMSVVLKLNYKDQSILLTGDIEEQTEYALTNATVDLTSDFLKLAHHGSKTSSTEDFLQAVEPQIAFIQAGFENRFGHPHDEVIDRLDKMDIPYYRNDIHGRIELVLDGQQYQIITEHNE